MSAVLLGDHPTGSPEWHALRRGRLGGSEIAAVVGLSPFQSRFTVWQRKAGRIGEQVQSEAMEWGHRHEPTICQKFTEMHPEYSYAPGGTYHHHERPWQMANPDRILKAPGVTEPMILEAKTGDGHSEHEWGQPGTGEIPPHYTCQGLWYLDVFGLHTAQLAVLIGGNDYREYVITYDAEQAEWLRDEGAKFIESVAAGHAPPIDGSDSTYQSVREMHPAISGAEVGLDPLLWERFELAKDSLTDAKNALQAVKAEVTDAMGDAQYGEVAGERVVRRQAIRGGTPFIVPIPQRKYPRSAA